MKKSKKGFASLPKDELIRVSRIGGSRKIPTKGYGSMSKEERSQASRRAAQIRWAKVREEKETHGTDNPTED